MHIYPALLCTLLPAVLVAGCSDATDPANNWGTLRVGTYSLITVNGARLPTSPPNQPTVTILTGSLIVTAPDTVAFEQTSNSGNLRIIQRGTYRALVQGSFLMLAPIIASGSLEGSVRGDTIRLGLASSGGTSVVNVYVHAPLP